MKISRGFIVFVVVFVAIVVGSMLLQPKQFNWDPTYGSADRQPLGCFVFDSIMRQTLPRGYEVSRKTFYQLNHDGTSRPRSILVVADRLKIDKTDLSNMLSLAAKGNRIFLAAGRDASSQDVVIEEEYYSHLADTLGATWQDFSTYNIKRTLLNNLSKADHTDTVRWTGLPKVYQQRQFVYDEAFNSGYIFFVRNDRKPWTTIVDEVSEDWKYEKVVVRPWGRGEIILCATPLLLTNYGVLHRATSPYVMRLMTLLADRPVVRTEAYSTATEVTQANHQSPLDVWLAQPQLALAWRLALLMVLLFFIFTARRRQRPIPILPQPRNHNLDFVRTIGSLYYHKHRNRDLVLTRWRILADDVRRRTAIDINAATAHSDDLARLSRITGISTGSLDATLSHLRQLAESEEKVSDNDMKHYIDQMNEIWNKTKE